MNKVQEILHALSDADLKAALAEMRALEDTGVLPDGQVRALAIRLQTEVGLSEHDARNTAQSAVFRIAAFKWAGLQ